MTPDMQAAFDELQDAIDVATTNGLLSPNADAMWDALCESLDDEERIAQSYEEAKKNIASDET